MSAPPVSRHRQRETHGTKLLRIIGVFKLLKGAALILGGLSVLHLLHVDLVDETLKWARRLHIAPGNRYLQAFLDKLLSVTRKQFQVLAAVLFAYSAMFITEGVGLCLLQFWAEWMTVITTIGLIPLEAYELIHRIREETHITLPALTLAINTVVAVYLIAHVWRRTHSQRVTVTPS
jgi:uncharacterized membrane protein (DUF2068 family)